MNEALFPSISDAPYAKDEDWLIRYAQAVVAQQSLMPFGYFSGNGVKLNEIRDYARGRQDTSIYKKMLKIEEDSSEDNNWFALDYSPLPIAAKFRRQALGLLKDYDYTVEARVVDNLSTEESDKYLERVKSAVRVREIAKKVAPTLAEDDTLNVDENQPSTVDEFEVWKSYSYKHRLSYEFETAVSHVFQTNKIQDLRTRWKTDLFDWGVAIAKEWVEDGEVRIRHVDPRRYITSYCDHNTFSDAIYAGEITTVPISKLRDMAGGKFDEEQYKSIAEATNPEKFRDLHNRRSSVGYFYDDLKVDVLDLELITTDYLTYKESVNKRGNKVIAKSGYKEATNPKKGAKYSTKTRSRIYKIKWIIGTKFAFDAGLCSHQKRRTGDPYKASLSYHAVAYDMDNMRIVGIAEMLRPIIDSLQLNWLKIQQTLISARPKGFAVNAGALEDVPIANGGMDMRPEDLIRFFVKHGILVYRQENIAGVPVNGIPITEMMNGVDPSIQIYWNNVVNAINLIRDSIGLNQVTDGGVNPRMLTTPTQMAGEATNNALSGIIESDEKLLLSLAEGAIMRIQSMLMAGDVYAMALGAETSRIIRLSKDLSIRDFGISLVKRPTEEEKRLLVEEAKALFGAELVDMSDIFFIKNISNMKAAEAMLSLRIEKKKRERMEQSMMMQQQNAEVQMQSNMASEQAKQQTLQLEYQLKGQLMQQEYELKMQLEEMKLQSREGISDKDRFVSALGVGSQLQIAETQAQQAQSEQGDQPMETMM